MDIAKKLFWTSVIFGLIYLNLIVLTNQIIAGKV